MATKPRLSSVKMNSLTERPKHMCAIITKRGAWLCWRSLVKNEGRSYIDVYLKKSVAAMTATVATVPSPLIIINSKLAVTFNW